MGPSPLGLRNKSVLGLRHGSLGSLPLYPSPLGSLGPRDQVRGLSDHTLLPSGVPSPTCFQKVFEPEVPKTRVSGLPDTKFPFSEPSDMGRTVKNGPRKDKSPRDIIVASFVRRLAGFVLLSSICQD